MHISRLVFTDLIGPGSGWDDYWDEKVVERENYRYPIVWATE
jgi:hypothetical protein